MKTFFLVWLLISLITFLIIIQYDRKALPMEKWDFGDWLEYSMLSIVFPIMYFLLFSDHCWPILAPKINPIIKTVWAFLVKERTFKVK